MKEPSKKKPKNRIVNEATTFTVPVALGEIKENITIYTNKENKQSTSSSNIKCGNVATDHMFSSPYVGSLRYRTVR